LISGVWLLAGFAYLLVFSALLFFRADLAALSLPFLVYLAVGVYFSPRRLRLDLERRLSAERVAGSKDAEVFLSLTNHGETLEEVYVEDRLEKRTGSSPTAKPLSLQTLPAGSPLDLRYIMERQRGEHLFEGLYVRASDHSGLFIREELLHTPGKVSFYPLPARLKRIPLRPRVTRGFAGYIPSRQGGSGTDFFGVREYQPGDPQRRINWRISARENETLYANEFEQERVVDIGLILDARQPGYPPRVQDGSAGLFESSVSAASSLAKSFLEDGNRVSLLIYGETIERVFPGYGKLQFDRIQRTLARAQLGFNYALENLQYLPTRLFPAHSQLVMISPLHQEDAPFYRRLLSQGYDVILVSPDPISEEARQLEGTPDIELAVRLARIDRAVQLKTIKKFGVRVVDWQPDRPLDGALQHALRSVPVGRRIWQETQ
jgi:uncharacterized protein (DUF58 family)